MQSTNRASQFSVLYLNIIYIHTSRSGNSENIYNGKLNHPHTVDLGAEDLQIFHYYLHT